MGRNDSTPDLSQLNAAVGIPGVVRVEPPRGGLPRIVVTGRLADAEIYLHGAQVTHFQPRGLDPVLFLSAKSHFEAAKAIRGGIPVIFQWFGPKSNDPSAPQHGLARTQAWESMQSTQEPDGTVAITLRLRSGPDTRDRFPRDFELLYTIRVGAELDLGLEVRNTSAASFTFEEALHTYLRVADIRRVGIEGLAGRSFIDKVDGMKRKTQDPGPMRITGETDRVYLDTSDTVIVTDPGLRRRIVVEKQGSASTVIWNPWIEKARAMSDFCDDEWPGMVCVETANTAENARTLAPRASHTMNARIAVLRT